jgi:hypothetical protein
VLPRVGSRPGFEQHGHDLEPAPGGGAVQRTKITPVASNDIRICARVEQQPHRVASVEETRQMEWSESVVGHLVRRPVLGQPHRKPPGVAQRRRLEDGQGRPPCRDHIGNREQTLIQGEH